MPFIIKNKKIKELATYVGKLFLKVWNRNKITKLQGRLLTLFANSIQVWEGLQTTNILAYYEHF